MSNLMRQTQYKVLYKYPFYSFIHLPTNLHFNANFCRYKGPCNMPQIRNIALENACNKGMTFKDTQGYHNCCY